MLARTEDDRLLEGQEEMHAGAWSENYNQVIEHGCHTTVPGSWIRGGCAHGNKACARLAGRDDIIAEECVVSQGERCPRRRLMNSQRVERSRQSEAFTREPEIFPDKDSQYEDKQISRQKCHAIISSISVSLVLCVSILQSVWFLESLLLCRCLFLVLSPKAWIFV